MKNQKLDLRQQHLEAGLDPSDLKYLETPTQRKRPTTVRGISID